MKEPDTKRILNDSQLHMLSDLNAQLQVVRDMVSQAISKRVLSIVENNDWDGIRRLSDIHGKLIECVDKCRNMMSLELADYDKSLMNESEYFNTFRPLSIPDKDMKWFCSSVSITEKDHVLKISLPLLMPNRKGSNTDRFIDSLIWNGLREYADRNLSKIDFGSEVVIAFCHIYDSKNRMRIKDHDNIEVKHCIDRIAQSMLVSDSGLNCQLYHKSQMGDTYKTDIYVMSETTAKEHLFDVFQWDFTGKK